MANMENYTIFHYGAFEAKYFSAMEKRYGGNKTVIECIRSASFNVLSVIYAKVYFPVYSNSLKDIASYLGFSWSSANISGESSVISRLVWELNGDQHIKDALLTYNYEDCKALQMVVQALRALNSEETGDAVSVEEMVRPYEQKFGKVDFVIPDMKKINKAAYFDYQLRKVHVRTNSTVRKIIGKETQIKKSVPKVNKNIFVPPPTRCKKCGRASIVRHRKYTRLMFDLKAGTNGVRKWVVRYNFAYYRCKACRRIWNNFEYRAGLQSKYGVGLIGWCVYKNIALRQTHTEILEEARETFEYNLARGVSSKFKKMASGRFDKLYDGLVEKVTQGKLVHADETKIDFRNGSGYV